MLKLSRLPYYLLLPLFVILMAVSCKKDVPLNEDPSFTLALSTNEILFDTVFSTLGSTTKYFTVKNSGDQKIRVSSIRLAGGSNSCFRINIDGDPVYSLTDVEIEANDSIYIFVKVTVDPQNSNTPMIVKDSVVFETNGNVQDVDLIAWGQDAHYIIADKVFGGSLRYKIVAGEGENITWPNDKPYVVYGYAVVDSTGQLNIDPGARIHFYNSGGMWIYKGGCLKVNGTQMEPVTFQGTRLEPAYSELPGQWDRIWINESNKDSEINYAIIKNGFIGIQAETLDASMGNQLVLNNTIIRNMTGIGIFSRFYKIRAGNCVIASCGTYGICLTTGGDYDFRHCTVGNYWTYSSRSTPSVVITNYYEDYYSGNVYTGDLDNAYFGNCILYGNMEEEMVLDSMAGAGAFNYQFDYCLVKTQDYLSDAKFTFCVFNSDPEFKEYGDNDYTLLPGSAAIDIGNLLVITSAPMDLYYDLAGNNRTVNPPTDIGAYDYRP